MNNTHYIVFQIGTKAYGLASAGIREVGRTKELRLNKVPKTPDYIRGIINLRGDVVPIIHLQRRLAGDGLEKELTDEPALPPRLIIVQHQAAYYGLLADKIHGHRCPENGHIFPPTEEMAQLTPYIEAIVREPEQTYFVLDLNQLF